MQIYVSVGRWFLPDVPAVLSLTHIWGKSTCYPSREVIGYSWNLYALRSGADSFHLHKHIYISVKLIQWLEICLSKIQWLEMYLSFGSSCFPVFIESAPDILYVIFDARSHGEESKYIAISIYCPTPSSEFMHLCKKIKPSFLHDMHSFV